MLEMRFNVISWRKEVVNSLIYYEDEEVKDYNFTLIFISNHLVIVAKYLKLETMNDFIFFIQLVN